MRKWRVSIRHLLVILAVAGACLLAVRQYLASLPRPMIRITRPSVNHTDGIWVSVFYLDHEEAFYDAKPFGTLNEVMIKQPGQKARHYLSREGGRPNRPGEPLISEAMNNYYTNLQRCLQEERHITLTNIAPDYHAEFAKPSCLEPLEK